MIFKIAKVFITMWPIYIPLSQTKHFDEIKVLKDYKTLIYKLTPLWTVEN